MCPHASFKLGSAAWSGEANSTLYADHISYRLFLGHGAMGILPMGYGAPLQSQPRCSDNPRTKPVEAEIVDHRHNVSGVLFLVHVDYHASDNIPSLRPKNRQGEYSHHQALFVHR